MSSQKRRHHSSIAGVVTNVFSPPFVSLFTFALAFFIENSWNPAVVLISAFCTTLFPLAYLAHSFKKGKIGDLHVTERRERIEPIALTTVGALAGFFALSFLDAPLSVKTLMFLYFSNSALLLAITIFWKISLHTYSITASATSTSYLFGFAGTPFYAVLLGVIWARLTLKAHTWMQVLTGAVFGFAFTSLQIAWLLPMVGLL
ncbi:MAG TPA: hypothetical protein VJA40_00865 [archaeon]|nr:hypothetical protein [archaeon]